MKILLVYPEYPDTFWSFKYALKFISKQASLPPLGLLTVAALLPPEWEKKLVDMTINSLKDIDIKWADYIFISAMNIQRESVNRVIHRAKRWGARIVAGGPLFTSEYEDYKELVDHLILQEAEITLPHFIEDLKKGCPKPIYIADQDQWAEINKSPIPLWELINLENYASMCIQYSRGCPFNCDFCDVTLLFGHKMRVKSKEQILAELESLYLKKWRGGVFFVDDNFIGNKKELKEEVLPAIISWMKKRNYPFSFTTQVSINLSDDEELMRLMVKAGFGSVFVGIETPNEESLAECNKLQNKNRDLIACVKKIQQSGLVVNGGFIMGFDHDTPAIFERIIEFIQKSGVVSAMVGLLNAPRGTKLYQRLVKENRLLKEASGNNTDFSINFIPKMNYKALITGYKKVLKTIYSPDYYYQRIKTLLAEIKPLPKHKFQFRFYYLSGFLKSVWLLGIIGRERVHYWRLFFWSLFNRPQLLPMAITYAVYGFHFRKIIKSH